MNVEPKYLNHKQAAQYLGISPGTLYIKVSKKEIPVHKFKSCAGNKFKIEELDNLLEPVR